MTKQMLLILSIAGLLMVLQPFAEATTIDFEGLLDSAMVTTQFSGLTFTNTTAITAGFSLNEFEFPPHSGVNVVFDDGGAISIDFAAPQGEVSGFFTSSTKPTFTAFAAFNNSVAIDTSAFNSNEALSGDPGSSPNEFLDVTFAGGIKRVTIAGDPLGGSCTLDDLTFTPATTAAPELSTSLLLTTSLLSLLGLRAWRGRH